MDPSPTSDVLPRSARNRITRMSTNVPIVSEMKLRFTLRMAGMVQEFGDQLRDHVGNHHSPVEFSGLRQTERHRRIQVRAGVWTSDEDAAHHGKSPGQGHYDPASAESFRPFQRHARHDAASQKNHHICSQELKETLQKYRNLNCFHNIIFTCQSNL